MRKLLLFTIILCAISAIALYSCNDTEAGWNAEIQKIKDDSLAKVKKLDLIRKDRKR